MEQFLTWTDLKALKTKKEIPFQYVEKSSKYNIWIQDGVQVYNTVLFKDVTGIGGIDAAQNNLDLTDWESNFKPNSRGRDSLNVNLFRYSPRFFTSKIDILLSDTVYTTLANINVDGQLIAISSNFDRDDVEFILEADGTEIFSVVLEDLKKNSEFNLGSNTFQGDFPIVVGANGKHITMELRNVDILSNLIVKAKKTKSSPTKMKSILIFYTEKIQ